MSGCKPFDRAGFLTAGQTGIGNDRD